MPRSLCSALTHLILRLFSPRLGLCAWLIFGLPLSALAALSIGSATVDGQAAVAVPPGGSFTGAVTATTDATNMWGSTGWSIRTTAPSSYTCVDTPNHTNANETATENVTLTAPATAGTYNAYFIVASNDGGSCSGQTATRTLANSVVVTAPTLSNIGSSGSAVIGGVLTFRITATNPLTIPMDNMVVTDTLGTGMTYATYVATAGTATVAGQVVTWTIPTIPANSSVQLTVAVTLTQSGTLTNTASAPGATSATASVLVLAQAATHFRMDETAGSWNGTAGEVLDSGGTGLQGQRYATAATTTNVVTPNPTIASQNASVVGSFCNAGNFDGNGIVKVASNAVLQYSTKLSASAWIYPTAAPTSDLYSILSNDQNYEFHLNTNRKLYWWWGGSPRELTSAASIPLNQWTHIAITMDASAGRQYIYINGVRDTNTNNWKGTLTTNNCDFYIGGDVTTGSCALINSRNFRGKIDEVKLYNFELSQAEVQADMTLGRQCSGDFDHIRIEHDGSGSICTPETVTVKACMDANCTTLYPGAVTVALSPSGWVGGNSFTFTGGIATRQLSIATASTVTLGSTSASPTPSNATRCYIGSTQNCSMTFASASCAFDAAETGGSPQSRIYTKLAGTAFNLDVLALSSSTVINTGYTGTATVDLVDTSTTNCPTGSGLTTAQSVTFTSGNSGRKPVSFTYGNAARNVRVRVKVGSSAPACSSDNFAIRPQQFVVSSSDMTNTAMTGTPKATAGTAFSLTANSSVGSGYDGTPAIDTTKINDHNGTAIASGTFSGTFSAATGVSATGNAFKYLDVGNIQFATDAVTDSGFTTVDQTTDCIPGSTSNTLSSGRYGCNVGSAASSKFGRWYPDHYSFTGTLTPGCGAGAFTYMGQDALAVALTIKAHATTGGTASASDPVTSRYTTGYTNLASVTMTGDNAGSSVALTRLTSPAFPTFPNTALWSSGLFAIADTYAFSRLASPDGPYDAFKLVPSLSDPDGSSLIGTSPATNTTSLRYGRLQIANAYGSELLDLTVPYEAQYWKGSYYTTNLLDSCTSFNVSSIMMSNFTQNLAACETQFSPTGTQTLTKGKLALKLTKPGVDASNVPNRGSVLLTQNIGSAASGSTCVSSTSSSATAANLSWFGNNPSGQATFGIYRSPYIYFREAY